jgi:hypothetical protein
VAGKNPAHGLMQRMVGVWKVEQRFWPGAGTEPVDLPPAIARRRMVEGAFLEEIMESLQTSGQTSFTRIAYFNYNAVNRQHEYFSLDSRAPQMMNERTYEAGIEGRSGNGNGMTLYGDSFVAPRWGEARNAGFRYRIAIGPVENDRQLVHLYLTPQSEESREFLAFEYVYVRLN